MKVLILGGSGVFGSRLARLLVEDGHEVVIAGRSQARLSALGAEIGAGTCVLDRADPAALTQALDRTGAQIFVDAAGPFQAYDGYAVAEAAIGAGVHYFDLSDDAGFTTGITVLDAQAKAAGVTVLSGVSSVPALSSAAVDALAQGLDEITLIESAICPGNKAPRGRSVMAAILAQIGAPLRLWRGGQWTEARGWSGRRMVVLKPGMQRPASLIGAPDLDLFPKAYGARSVLFRAGLELGVMHRSLQVMSWLRGRRLLPDLTRFVGLFHWAAGLMVGFGSARGGMAVEVSGRVQGHPVTRAWRLSAWGGEGPVIPAIPGAIVVDMIAKGALPAGAGAALSVFDLPRGEAELARLKTEVLREETAAPRLFEAALGDRWAGLPAEVRRLHDLWDREEWQGEAEVSCASHPLARLVARVFGFPLRPGPVPVRVTLERQGEQELWRRDFGGQRFGSRLGPARPGHVSERFGPFVFELELTGDASWLGLRAARGWLGPLPLPGWLMPVSEGREWVEDGRFHFDVPIALPGIGLVVRYRGWLVPAGSEGGTV